MGLKLEAVPGPYPRELALRLSCDGDHGLDHAPTQLFYGAPFPDLRVAAEIQGWRASYALALRSPGKVGFVRLFLCPGCAKEAFTVNELLNFSDALAALKAGKRVARAGWNGKGMFLYLVAGSTFRVNREPLLSILGEGTEVQYHAHIDMKTAQGYCVPWIASQADLLSEDWEIVG